MSWLKFGVLEINLETSGQPLAITVDSKMFVFLGLDAFRLETMSGSSRRGSCSSGKWCQRLYLDTEYFGQRSKESGRACVRKFDLLTKYWVII